MKYFKFSSTLFLLLVHILVPTIQSSNRNLIEKTCKKTPYYNACVSSLNSDPRSKTADVRGLALIMVDAISSNTKQILTRINEMLRKNPSFRKELNACASLYGAGILQADVPMAIEGLKKGNYKFAEQGSDDAANEANFCEKGFNGKSPLTFKNKVLQQVSSVAASIVRVLM